MSYKGEKCPLFIQAIAQKPVMPKLEEPSTKIITDPYAPGYVHVVPELNSVDADGFLVSVSEMPTAY